MGIFSHFPYSNFHELNLDWILSKFREFTEKINMFSEKFEGGNKGQVLRKKTDKDLDFEWTTIQAVTGSLPVGGVKGQFLTKNSASDFDASWIYATGILKSVKDYGAMGDGITNDTDAIKKAIEENSFIYFPSGIYLISETLTLKAKQTLIGDGVTSIIKLADNSNCNMIESENFQFLFNTDNHESNITGISIINMAFDGNYVTNPEIIAGEHVIKNSFGNGICIYGSGIRFSNIYVYNCADHGIITEWNSYLTTYRIATGGEALFINVVTKLNGKSGWYFAGPHDSKIVNLIAGTNNRKNEGHHNMYVGSKGNFLMTNSHLYSDYGTPKVVASLYLDSGALPCTFNNCDIEGGGTADIIAASSGHIFNNCRIYASFGSCDVYLGNVKNLQFNACRFEKQATEEGVVNPNWNGAVELSVSAPLYSIFDGMLIDTHFCSYASADVKSIIRLSGYNNSYNIGGTYRAIPDPETYTVWQSCNISIVGDFGTVQDNYAWINNSHS